MLNEFVYCQRLFYYEFVEGVFVESADTLRGGAIHQRVDTGTGALPSARSSRREEAHIPSESKKAGEGSQSLVTSAATAQAGDSITNRKSEIENEVIHSRNHLEPPEPTILKLKRASEDALAAESIEELLGIEGAAASQYFQQFSGMVKVEDDLPGLGLPVENTKQRTFR